jgi:hypothetical protein
LVPAAPQMIGYRSSRKHEAFQIERSSYPGLVIHTLSSFGHKLPIRLHVSLLKDGSIKGQNIRVNKNLPVGSNVSESEVIATLSMRTFVSSGVKCSHICEIETFLGKGPIKRYARVR